MATKLNLTLKQIAKKAGLSMRALSDAAGLRYTVMSGMAFGNTSSIQRDVALRICRAGNADTKLLQPFISESVPRGAKKRQMEKAREKADSIFKVPCPCCEGIGSINVKKV